MDGAVWIRCRFQSPESLSPHLPVVAVVLTPPVKSPSRMAQIPLPVQIPSPIIDRLTRTRVAQAFTIFLQAVDTGGRMVTELRLRVDEPEVVIRPAVDGIGLLDRVDVHQVVLLGEKSHGCGHD